MKLHADSRFGLLVSPTDPTDLLDPSDQSGQSEKKTEIGDRISKFLNVTICTPPNSKKIRAFSCISWLKTFLDALYIDRVQKDTGAFHPQIDADSQE